MRPLPTAGGRGVGPPGRLPAPRNVRVGDRPECRHLRPRSRRRCGQPVPLSTGLSTGSCPRQSTAVSGPSEAPDSGGTKDVGPGPDRLDRRGTRPGGPTLSSLPLDEWHYMRINEMVCVRLRPARRHACRRAAKRPGRCFGSSTVDIPVGSLSPDPPPERGSRSHSRQQSQHLMQVQPAQDSRSAPRTAFARRRCRIVPSVDQGAASGGASGRLRRPARLAPAASGPVAAARPDVRPLPPGRRTYPCRVDRRAASGGRSLRQPCNPSGMLLSRSSTSSGRASYSQRGVWRQRIAMQCPDSSQLS